MTDPLATVQVPEMFRRCVSGGDGQQGSANCPVEALPIVDYIDLLLAKCDALDELLAPVPSYLRDTSQFFFSTRALYEFSRILCETTRRNGEGYRELMIAAHRLYMRSIDQGNALRPMERTHPTRWAALESEAREAINLMVQDRQMGDVTLNQALGRCCADNVAPAVRDLINDVLLVNYSALGDRIGRTHLSADLSAFMGESLTHMSGGTDPPRASGAPDPAPRDSIVPDWLMKTGKVLGASFGSGPIGNSAAIHVMTMSLHNLRTRESQRFARMLVNGLSWATGGGGSIRAALEAGHYAEATRQLRTNFQAGPLTTAIPALVDWLSVINSIDQLVHADTNGERARAGWDAFQSGVSGVADSAVALRRFWNSQVVSVQLRERLGLMRVAEEIEAAAGQAVRVTHVEAQASVAFDAEMTALAARGVSTIGGRIAFGFSVINAFVELADGVTDVIEGDYTGATWAGFRCVGSAMIAIGLCMPGPWSAVVGGIGLGLTIVGTVADGEEEDPMAETQRLMLRLINDIRTIRSNGQGPSGYATRHNEQGMPLLGRGRPIWHTMMDTIGVDGDAQEVWDRISAIPREDWGLIETSGERESHQVLARIEALRIYRRVPLGLVTTASANRHPGQMRQ